MSAEVEKATQQGESAGPPVTAATSVAEIPAPHVPKKQDESESAGPLANGGVGGVVPDPDAPQGKTEPAPADKPAESGEPTTSAPADSRQTNGAAKPAVAEPVAAAAAAEKLTEPAPAATETPGANGEAKPTEDVDMEGSAPAATEEDDRAVATAEDSKKRDAATALGPDADTEGDAAGGKKAKTTAVDTAAPETTLAAAKPEAAKSPSIAETANGGGGAGAGNGAGAGVGAKPADTVAAAAAAPPAPAAAPAPPAKKGGRPKKQAGKVAAAAAALVGRTARKTRSQGPVEL